MHPDKISQSVYLCYQFIPFKMVCTMENQRCADERLPIFRSLSLDHKDIIVEPMLEAIDFHGNLVGIDSVTVGGESGMYARP